MLNIIKEYIRLTGDIFYPRLCLACESESYAGEIPICIKCLNDLPLTDIHNQAENLLTERILGRIDVRSSAALFYFTKKGKAQHLIHQAKYSGDPQIARLLGNWMGTFLKDVSWHADIDIIVPVPLHHTKMRSRGYNQSAEFGRGIGEILDIHLKSDALMRIQRSISQTTKNRVDRLTNVHSSFELNETRGLQNKHILLVDDVLTTGATIEACAEKLLSIEGTKISLCVMALVMD